jgi:hypothetical protein
MMELAMRQDAFLLAHFYAGFAEIVTLAVQAAERRDE